MTLYKRRLKPVLLYPEEHRSCQNYISDFSSGFSRKNYKQGKTVRIHLDKQFAVIFMQKGRVSISSDFGEKKKVSTDEMALLDYEKEYTCKIEQESVFTVLYFDHPKIKCDKYSLLSLNNFKKKTEDTIRVLPMVEPIKIFIENMNTYLKHKMMCRHLHDLKESEWLFLMRGFYTKEQSAYLLEPIINSLDDFTSRVKDYYMKCDSVRELAEKCNMSEKTFTRRFKEHFNCTPKQWMLREKAKYIKSELENNTLNVKQVANKFGFSSPAHLNNYYKKQFNTTPGKEKTGKQVSNIS